MKAFVFFVMALFLAGCGVKGDPLPPYKKPYVGRGKPNYKGAMKEFSYKEVPKLEKKAKEDEEEENE